MVRPDKGRDHGLPRMVGLVLLSDRLFCAVFVDRPPERPIERQLERRIIILGKANRTQVPVGEGVSELRIHHGPGYRVYLLKRGNVPIVFMKRRKRLWGHQSIFSPALIFA